MTTRSLARESDVRTTFAWLQRILREPFLHFVVLGVATFALQRSLTRLSPERPALVITQSDRSAVAALFEERQQRAATPDERAALERQLIDDEVLFREGLRLDLVHSDAALREQVIARVRSLLQASVPSATPSDDELRAFFRDHTSDYQVPETVSYRAYVIPSGSDAEDSARALQRALTRGEPVQALPTQFQERSLNELSALYGSALAQRMLALTPGAWQVVRAARGVHVVALDSHTPAHDLGFESVRERLQIDYQIARTQRAFDAELARLRSRWEISREGDAP